jgi:hypothetical protein
VTAPTPATDRTPREGDTVRLLAPPSGVDLPEWIDATIGKVGTLGCTVRDVSMVTLCEEGVVWGWWPESLELVSRGHAETASDPLAEVSRILCTASDGDVVADAQAAMDRQVEIAEELAKARADLEVARSALTLMDPQALRSVVELLGGAPREEVPHG